MVITRLLQPSLYLFASLFALLLTPLASPRHLLHADTYINVQLDRRSVIEGESIALQVVLSPPYLDAEVHIASSPFFDIHFQGSSLAQTFHSAKGSGSTRTMSYVLTAKQTGTLATPVVSVLHSGEVVFQSEEATVHVKPLSGTVAQPRIQFDSTPSRRTVYQGQQLVVANELHARGIIRQARDLSNQIPEVWSEDFPDSSTVSSRSRRTWKRAFFPLRGGPLALPRQTVEVVFLPDDQSRSPRADSWSGWLFDDFFSRQFMQRQVLEAERITVEVQPLPAPPESIASLLQSTSPLVGDLEVRLAPLSNFAAPVQRGTPLRFSLTLRSNANPRQLRQLHNLDSRSDLLISVSSESTENSEQDGMLWSEHIVTFTVVPLDSGTTHFGPLVFPFFHPELGEYLSLSTPTFSFDVVGEPREFEDSVIPDEHSVVDAETVLTEVGGFPAPPAAYTQPTFLVLIAFVAALIAALARFTLIRLRQQRDLNSWRRQCQQAKSRTALQTHVLTWLSTTSGESVSHLDSLRRNLERIAPKSTASLDSLAFFELIPCGSSREQNRTLELLKQKVDALLVENHIRLIQYGKALSDGRALRRL